MPLIISGTNGISTDGATWAFDSSASGLVPTPYQPAFHAHAYLGATPQTYTTTGTFDSTFTVAAITTALNTGSCFNATNGRFTAPVAGRYFFTGSFTRYNGNAVLGLYKNGGAYIGNHLSYGADVQVVAVSAVIDLAASDYVTLMFGATNTTTITGYRIHFSGIMI